MRRITSLAASIVATLTFAGPLSPAVAGDSNVIQGSPDNDRLFGTSGDDLIVAGPGDDRIRPRSGADRVRAGFGDDIVFLFNDGDVDRIHCGPGFDTVAYRYVVDQHDILDDNCEGIIA